MPPREYRNCPYSNPIDQYSKNPTLIGKLHRPMLSTDQPKADPLSMGRAWSFLFGPNPVPRALLPK